MAQLCTFPGLAEALSIHLTERRLKLTSLDHIHVKERRLKQRTYLDHIHLTERKLKLRTSLGRIKLYLSLAS